MKYSTNDLYPELYYFNKKMNVKERLKFLQNKKFIKMLVIVIVLYSVSISILVSYISFTFFQTVESISLPSGYFAANLNSSSPFVETSFSISNTGIFECNDLRLELNFEVEYFKDDEFNSTINQIMYHIEEFDKIESLQNFDYLITSSESDFNTSNLIAFETTCNQSKLVKYYLSVGARGLYFFRILSFSVNIKQIPIYIL